MADFIAADKLVSANEGGYVNDPDDAGGETYAGITRKNFPEWKGWDTVDVHKPKRGDILPELHPLVLSFYKINFWDRLKGDMIDSQRVALFTYDWYVNSGAHALKALQRAVGVNDDGVIGPATISAVNGYSEIDLMAHLLKAREEFCKAIVEEKPSQGKFLKGWLERANRVAAIVTCFLFFVLTSNAQDTTIVHHHAYTTVFAQSAHIPVLVTYALHKEQITCPGAKIPRASSFKVDPAITGTQLYRDYEKSGYDIGHNMSADDNSCSVDDMYECFYYSNMFPQAPGLNRVTWLALELHEREMARANDSVVVFIGSYGLDRKIGHDSIYVPQYCWKVIYTPTTGNYDGYMFSNVMGSSYAKEALTGDQLLWARYVIGRWTAYKY